jgi:hypothetical protein
MTESTITGRNVILLTHGVICDTVAYEQPRHQAHLVGQRCAEEL